MPNITALGKKKPHSICNLKNGANTKEHKFPAGLLQI